MEDDSELEMDDDSRPRFTKRRRTGADNGKFYRILLVILLLLIFAGGIYYFVSKQSTIGEASLLQLRVTASEQKIAELEKQLADLQGKISTSGSDPTLFQRVDALTQKVEGLERKKQPKVGLKAEPSIPLKPIASTPKQYHTVQKGETLYRISKKYRIRMEELRKLNNLSPGQQIHIGQKLLVSTER
jgi:LysM repeat protein